jgi:hypothetical protein
MSGHIWYKIEKQSLYIFVQNGEDNKSEKKKKKVTLLTHPN